MCMEKMDSLLPLRIQWSEEESTLGNDNNNILRDKTSNEEKSDR